MLALLLSLCLAHDPDGESDFRGIRVRFITETTLKNMKMGHTSTMTFRDATIENISLYLMSFLKVIPYESVITLDTADIDGVSYPPMGPTGIGACDLYLLLYENDDHPSKTDLPYITYVAERDKKTERPIVGYVIHRKSRDGPHRDDEMLAAIFEILGINKENMGYWRDGRGIRYSKHPALVIKGQNGTKGFCFVNTPHAHEFIKERFGVKLMPDGFTRSGIEMNRRFDRLHGRTYFGEVPSGFPMGRVTNATMALLRDTGWYRVNSSRADGNPWNDPLILGKYTSKFPFGAPQTSMPKSHLKTRGVTKHACSFDFSGVEMDYRDIDCRKERGRYSSVCLSRSYYNVRGLERLYPESCLDYQPIVHDFLKCEGEVAVSGPGEYAGPMSRCFISSIDGRSGTSLRGRCYRVQCDENGNLTIVVKSSRLRCEREGQLLSLNGWRGEIHCPNPKRFCDYVKFKQNEFVIPKGEFWIEDRRHRTIIKDACVFVIGVVLMFVTATLAAERYFLAKKSDFVLQKQPGEQPIL